MQYLRDNQGVLEASANGTDWEVVAIGEGGGGPLTNPFTLGDIQVREDSGEFQLSRDAGVSWQRIWDTGANMLWLDGKVFGPPITTNDNQPGTWSLTVGSIALWWEPTAQKLWLIYWRAQGEWYRMQLTPNGLPAALSDPVAIGNGRIRYAGDDQIAFSNDAGVTWFSPADEGTLPDTLADSVNIGAAGVVRISNDSEEFKISEDGGSIFKTPVYIGDGLNVEDTNFFPPLIESDEEPDKGGLYIWHDTTAGNEKYYLVYQQTDTNYKVQLS